MSSGNIFSLPIVLALSLSLALKIALIIETPLDATQRTSQLSAYNDERAHVNYIAHVLQSRSLPKMSEAIDTPGAIERGQFENYQPPLYYSLTASICKVVNATTDQQITQVARCTNLILSFALIGVWLWCSRIFAVSQGIQSAGAIFLALNGTLLRFSVTATNDMLLWLCTGFMFVALAKSLLSPTHTFLLLWMVSSTAALYTKSSALILFALFPLLYLALVRFRISLTVVFAVVIPLLLSWPIWMRNVNDFGSLLPLQAGFGAPDFSWPNLDTLAYTIRSFINPYQESWRGLADAIYFIPILVLIYLSKKVISQWSRDKKVLMATSIGVALAAFIWLNLNFRQAEAKYLLTTWPAWVLLLCAGIGAGRSKQWIFLSANVFMLLPIIRLLADS